MANNGPEKSNGCRVPGCTLCESYKYVDLPVLSIKESDTYRVFSNGYTTATINVNSGITPYYGRRGSLTEQEEDLAQWYRDREVRENLLSGMAPLNIDEPLFVPAEKYNESMKAADDLRKAITELKEFAEEKMALAEKEATRLGEVGTPGSFIFKMRKRSAEDISNTFAEMVEHCLAALEENT